MSWNRWTEWVLRGLVAAALACVVGCKQQLFLEPLVLFQRPVGERQGRAQLFHLLEIALRRRRAFPPERARHLRQPVERARQAAGDRADPPDGDAEEERRMWCTLGSEALARIWENDADAAYDNWKELHGVQDR